MLEVVELDVDVLEVVVDEEVELVELVVLMLVLVLVVLVVVELLDNP